MAAPCNRCAVVMTSWQAASTDDAVCGYCGAHSIVRVFPAAFRTEAPAAAAAAGEGEAACYDHPGKLAVAHCGQCGRFVCQLCAVDFRGGVWCPSCITTGAERGKAAELERERPLYDSTALMLAAAPLLMWPLTLLTAPAALYVALRYWRRPLSLVRPNRWRTVVAIVVAGAELTAWIWGTAYLTMLTRAAK